MIDLAFVETAADSLDVISGGSGLDCIVSARRTSPGDAAGGAGGPLNAYYLGLVGSDEIGERLQSFASSVSTDSTVIAQVGKTTCRKHDVEMSRRQFFCSALLDNLLTIYDQYSVIYCPGSLLTSFEGIDVLLNMGYKLSDKITICGENKCICCSLCNREILHVYKDQLDAFMPFVDFLFGTEEQALGKYKFSLKRSVVLLNSVSSRVCCRLLWRREHDS